MGKLVVMILLGCFLCGCAGQEVMETVADELVVPALAQLREISVSLPDNAVAPAAGNGGAQIYYSDDYEIVLETVSSGDLNGTIRAMSGYGPEKLTIVQTRRNGADCHEFVWACAGETGERLGRGIILDDGHYHYCMSVLRDVPGEEKSQIVWDQVFSSFTLV